MKTFTIAGTSTLNGVIKNRFANGTVKVREQILTRNGHTAIKLVELPQAMSKADAVAFLESQTIMTPTGEISVAEVQENEFDPMDDVNYVGHPIHY